jgi:hypothetical protein
MNSRAPRALFWCLFGIAGVINAALVAGGLQAMIAAAGISWLGPTGCFLLAVLETLGFSILSADYLLRRERSERIAADESSD